MKHIKTWHMLHDVLWPQQVKDYCTSQMKDSNWSQKPPFRYARSETAARISDKLDKSCRQSTLRVITVVVTQVFSSNHTTRQFTMTQKS